MLPPKQQVERREISRTTGTRGMTTPSEETYFSTIRSGLSACFAAFEAGLLASGLAPVLRAGRATAYPIGFSDIGTAVWATNRRRERLVGRGLNWRQGFGPRGPAQSDHCFGGALTSVSTTCPDEVRIALTTGSTPIV